MKCSACGKTISKVYWIDKDPLGYECYKREMAIRHKKFEDDKNAQYQCQCAAAIMVLKNKRKNHFIDSILRQWSECHKITGKQLKCILNSFSVEERVEYHVSIFYASCNDDTKKEAVERIESLIQFQGVAEKYMDDDRINNALVEYGRNRIQRYGFFYAMYIDPDFPELSWDGPRMFDGRKLTEYQSDPDTKVLKIVQTEEQAEECKQFKLNCEERKKHSQAWKLAEVK